MRPSGVGPGERLVWLVLMAAAFVAVILYLFTTLDASVVCSNNQPC